jgi:hypothetical protein
LELLVVPVPEVMATETVEMVIAGMATVEMATAMAEETVVTVAMALKMMAK